MGTVGARRSIPADSFLLAGTMLVGVAAGWALVATGVRVGGPAGPAVVVLLPTLCALGVLVLADPRVGLFAVVAAFPVGVLEVPASQLQLVQVATLAVAVLVVLRRLGAGAVPLPWTTGIGLVAAFVAWLLVASLSAADQQRAAREVVLFAIGLLFAAVVVAACRSTADVKRFVAALVGLGGVVGASTLVASETLRAAYEGTFVQGRAVGIFTQPNQLGTFCATAALLGLGLLFAARTRRGRLLSGLAVGGAVVGLLLSLSRGSWIGFVLGSLVLLAKLPEARRLLALVVAPLVLVAVSIGAFTPTSPQVEIVGQRLRSITGERNPYDNRPAIWREARRELEADPLTGQGPGNFPVASTRATSESRTVFADHAHNLLLAWGSEGGVPAVGLAVAVGAHLHLRTRRLARRRSRADAAVLAGLAAALAAVAGQGIVDYTLHHSVVLTTLFALLGAVFAFDHLDRADRA